MRVLVVGAIGGVGRSAVRAAHEQGHEVRAASRSGVEVAPSTTAVAVDVRDFEAVLRCRGGGRRGVVVRRCDVEFGS